MPQKVCYNLLPTEQGQSARGLRSSHNCADINFVVALNLTLHLPGRTDMHYARIYNIVHICMCSLSVCVGVCLCSYLTRTRNTIKQHLNARLVFVQLDTTRHVACARNNWYFNGPTELSGCLLVGGYRRLLVSWRMRVLSAVCHDNATRVRPAYV